MNRIIFILILVLLLLTLVDVTLSNGNYLFSYANWEVLLYQFRMPRALAAIAAGGALAVAGLIMQNIFKNDLAGPDVLGISRGASLFVALTILLGIGANGVMVAAILGAVLYLLFLLWVSRFLTSNVSLLLVGIMLGFVLSAVISTLEVFSNAEALKSFVIWGMGSFSKVAIGQIYALFILVLFVVFAAFSQSKTLDTMLLGTEKAILLGVDAKKSTIIGVLIAGIAVGVVTALCGPIAFVGLVAPHLCKWFLKTYKHRLLIPVSFLIGAIIALLADFLSSGIFGNVILPINATLSMLAAPIIFVLIIKKK